MLHFETPKDYIEHIAKTAIGLVLPSEKVEFFSEDAYTIEDYFQSVPITTAVSVFISFVGFEIEPLESGGGATVENYTLIIRTPIRGVQRNLSYALLKTLKNDGYFDVSIEGVKTLCHAEMSGGYLYLWESSNGDSSKQTYFQFGFSIIL
jgi:hypothetical protein